MDDRCLSDGDQSSCFLFHDAMDALKAFVANAGDIRFHPQPPPEKRLANKVALRRRQNKVPFVRSSAVAQLIEQTGARFFQINKIADVA